MNPSIYPIHLIAIERARQIDEEGFDKEHDKQHENGDLAMAAALYASPNDNLFIVEHCNHCGGLSITTDPWPWFDEIDPPRGGPKIPVHSHDKRQKHSRLRRLQIAGALIVAEMERLQELGEEL